VPLRAGQTPQPSHEDTSRATYVYEMALKNAVTLGGQQLAEQTRTMVPEVVLTTEPPIVRGHRLPDYGFLFDVQAPDIQHTMRVLDMLLETRPVQPEPRAAAAQPVSQGRTAATGLIEADPMLAPPGIISVAAATTAYTSYVRQNLIDAMLDSSSVLPLGTADRLTIVASGVEQPNANPLYRPRKLMITITGADLQDFRQGRISREEAKARILESRE
jgi:hypothetical protein